MSGFENLDFLHGIHHFKMTFAELITYLGHLIKARHFRGHGIHSPYLYSYVREVVIKRGDIYHLTVAKYPGKRIEVVTDVSSALSSDAYITILHRPFRTMDERRLWKTERSGKEFLTIHLPHDIVIFRDERLHNQHFTIRRY